MKVDKDAVLAAVAKDPYELRCASEKLKGDRDVVSAALKRFFDETAKSSTRDAKVAKTVAKFSKDGSLLRDACAKD